MLIMIGYRKVNSFGPEEHLAKERTGTIKLI